MVSQNKSPASTPYNEVWTGGRTRKPLPCFLAALCGWEGGTHSCRPRCSIRVRGVGWGTVPTLHFQPSGDQILPGSPTPPPSLSFATPEVRTDSRLDNDSLGAGRGGGYPSPPSQPRSGSPPSPSPTRFLAVRENWRRRPLARPRPRWPSPRADLPAKPGPDARGLEGTRPAVT